MSHASLRTLRVALYSYVETTDDATGITASSYLRVLSPDADGLWWASRGTVFGRQTAPAGQPQEEETSFWSFSAHAPVHENGVIVLGPLPEEDGPPPSGTQVFQVQAVMDRNYFRDAVQVFCTHVDDADPTIMLAEPE